MSKLLDKYLTDIERKKERKRQGLLKKTQEVLNTLSSEISFREAYIFGSILKRKKFYLDSDIDIAILGLKDKDFFYVISRVADMLGRDVDIIQLERHPLKDKIIQEGLLWRKQN